ncbi:uncharacterized protein LOC111466127 isoform X2 [Cucurbita maxima]|uniref:Uncharacterized protein LOC111466127 isoform X2 n=1 Tax=Cucurbita maxima TaxID=3661 RepID=A0A6J1HN39_CUCMA|nr:uncharacterized protein LOC111466127 isoform X2 [Cucurbita maxima]
MKVFQYYIRWYISLLCSCISFFVVLAETEWEFILKNCVAVMTRAFPVYSVEKRELILLQDAASYLLLACGAIYVVSGIMCIGFLKRAREERDGKEQDCQRSSGFGKTKTRT